MEGKRVEVFVCLMLLMAMLGVRSTNAHLPPGTCIKHCIKECKLSGIGVPVCVKYCPVHCLPPDTTKKQRYCNLGCMLDICAKFTDGKHFPILHTYNFKFLHTKQSFIIADEKKMTDCVFNCGKFHCQAGS
ncbi:hypothetical protein BUALT_Bualt08G0148900 [Buddleja alternifolia]|uniref:Uncharacterized protein n=1 Tax=Buddleja alternifolia TaxID=168488 RepID=A0AAV6X801_9LAMI|nr:hypothetical protein BUALT_Bualt08G0148900 [Buddleja alternifolia]